MLVMWIAEEGEWVREEGRSDGRVRRIGENKNYCGISFLKGF